MRQRARKLVKSQELRWVGQRQDVQRAMAVSTQEGLSVKEDRGRIFSLVRIRCRGLCGQGNIVDCPERRLECVLTLASEWSTV